VETRLSFLNQLVGFLTLGIYTPMDIRVTCAEEAPMETSILVREPGAEGWASALEEAATLSRLDHRPAYVVAGD
jgi:hypothetical protein